LSASAQINLPDKLVSVFTGEADVRGAYGGRGSAKTRTFAKMTAVRACMWSQAGEEGIILCGRQFMNSLEDSSLEEIKAAIRSEPWLAPHFEIGEKYVRTADGTHERTSFAGLDRIDRQHQVQGQHQAVHGSTRPSPSLRSAWQTLIPTLREEDSELWVTWNPKRKGSSTTDKRFPR
jgi:phage terminase large subunit